MTTGGLNNGQKKTDNEYGKVPDFIPGQDGNLYWNTSVAMNQRPILFYMYNGHDIDNEDCERSKEIEKKCFTDKKIIKICRDFVCEKVCFGCSEFNRRPKHRQPLHAFMDRMAESGSVKTTLAILDPSGNVLYEYKDKAPSPRALLAALRTVTKDYCGK